MLKFAATALLIVPLMILATLQPTFAEEAKLLRSIAISGHGEVQAVPDLAQVSMGVTSFGKTAREALDGNTKAMQNLLASLKSAGIDNKDITTSNFSVGPRFDYGENNGQPPKLVGYDVNNMVTAIVRQTDKLGAVLDKAVSAGSNQITGITFTVSTADLLLDEARKTAIAEARRKAEIYAGAGGFALGNIFSVSEGGGYQPPVVYATKARAESADVPIAQGEQTLSVDVNVVWEIK